MACSKTVCSSGFSSLEKATVRLAEKDKGRGVGYFREALGRFWFRWRLIAFLNVLFFSVVLGAAVAAQLLLPPPLSSGGSVSLFPWPLTNLGPAVFFLIFVFNLAVSAFVVVTLPGFVFFPLSACILAFRAILWGLLLYPLPSGNFLAALPIVFLEGEGYVLAAAAGTVVGLSWFRPSVDLSRREAFRNGLQECGSIYVVIFLLLLAAAVAETATILLIQT